MRPTLGVALFAAAFLATHVGLATRRIRGGLIARLGERGFGALYFAVASLTFAALVAYYAAHRLDGSAGLALAATSLRWPLIVAIVAGMLLMLAGLVVYPTLPSALFAQPIRRARGIERITRHPFFAGSALVFGAHALLATRLTGAIFCAALALLAVVGAMHQDTKLLLRRGAPYATYLSETSAMPFAALIAGRQRLVWRELPLRALAGGLVVALLLRQFHGALFVGGGVWMIVAVIGGGVIASLQGWRRARRVAVRADVPAVARRAG